MKTRWILLPLLLLGAVSHGKEPTKPVASTKPVQKTIRCRMLVPDHVMIPARVGEEDGYFMIDTGNPFCMVPTDLVKRLKPADPQAGLGPVALPVRIGGQDLVVQALSMPAFDAVMAPGVKAYPDLKLFGFLGYPFLSPYTVRLDYLGRELSLWDPEALPLPGKETLGEDHVLLDFETDAQGHLFVRDCAVGETLKGCFHLDIGSPRFNFSRRLAQQAGIQGAVIPDCRAGRMAFRDVPWRERNFLDVFPYANLIGELGNAQLMNTVVTIHYAKKKIEIRRDRAALPIPPLGIVISPDGHTVSGVEAGSPAERNGVKAGDQLLSVNGQRTPSRSFLMDALSVPSATRRAEIKVLREGAEVTLLLEPDDAR